MTHPLLIAYHDAEWGVPLHDDRKLFENFILDGFQAGLSWLTILKKRQAFREAFNGFDMEKIAVYDLTKINRLLENPEIIRNNLKIHAAVTNAQQSIRVVEEWGSFDAYIWQFTGGRTITNHRNGMHEIPATSPESDAMSRDMKKRGFKFAGSTICYAFMQAVGMVNDHIVTCTFYPKG